MDKQALVLGHILRQFPNFEFSMDTFDGRLRLQKIIYLLQAHDIYLGYDFSWYLRGPYCTTLATSGFILNEFYPMMSTNHKEKSEGFLSNIIRARFKKFRDFIQGKENDSNFLEAAASLDFLLKTDMVQDDDMAVDKVFQKMQNGYKYHSTQPDEPADKSYITSVLKKIKKYGLCSTSSKGNVFVNMSPTKPITVDLSKNKQIQIEISNLPRDMETKYVDKTMFFTLQDAMAGDGHVELVGKNIFKPDIKRPIMDEYAMDDKMVWDIRRKQGLGIPANNET